MSKEDQGGAHHIRVVELRTADDKRREGCVLKLRSLLALAEQGEFTDVIIITDRGPQGHSLHWTPLTGREIAFLGALEMMKRILVDSIKITGMPTVEP